jgi:hypothetical protein
LYFSDPVIAFQMAVCFGSGSDMFDLRILLVG